MDLREKRLSKGWSQEQLAEISGLSVRTIQRAEKSGSTGLETLKALAAAFDTTVEEMQTVTNTEPERQDMKTDSEAIANEPFVPREWRGLLIHLVVMMVVATWLLFIAKWFDLEMGWIFYSGMVWVAYLVMQAFQLSEASPEPDKELINEIVRQELAKEAEKRAKKEKSE